MLDKHYLNGLNQTRAKHSQLLQRRLHEVKNMKQGGWYDRNNERDILYDCIEDLQAIVKAQGKIIDTLCNDRIREGNRPDR